MSTDSQITPEQSKQMGEQPETGEQIVDGRVSVYGGITDTYPRIAQMISGLLGHEVQAWQVPLILVCLKLVRTTEAPDYSDNSDDVDGYMHIFRELIGEDMIHARSVDEYLQKKTGSSAPAPSAWPLPLETVHDIIDHLMNDGTRDGLMHADQLNAAMGASARRRAEQS